MILKSMCSSYVFQLVLFSWTCCFFQFVKTGALQWCLKGMLLRKQEVTLFIVIDGIKRMTCPEITIDEINNLQNDTHVALAMLERDFPLSLQVNNQMYIVLVWQFYIAYSDTCVIMFETEKVFFSSVLFLRKGTWLRHNKI